MGEKRSFESSSTNPRNRSGFHLRVPAQLTPATPGQVCVVALEGMHRRGWTCMVKAPTLASLAGPRFRSNPYDFYARLRRENPVLQVMVPDGSTAWLITRYDDALAALKDKRLSKDIANLNEKPPWVPSVLQPLARNMLDLDDPDHARLRTLVHKAFTPKLIETLRTSIDTLTEDLISAAKPRGWMDLIADFALPLPVAVISGMLGVPKHEQHKFHRWSSAIVSSQSSKIGALKALPRLPVEF